MLKNITRFLRRNMMHKVNRAIIMAAGKGNRMHPITLTIPKPLVTVNGVRMIDTVIRGLHKNEINRLNVGAAVIVKGELVATPQAKQPFEIHMN